MDGGAFVGCAGCADEGGLEGVVVDFWDGHIDNSQSLSLPTISLSFSPISIAGYKPRLLSI